MKMKALITIILFMSGFMAVQAQDNIFEKLSDHKNIATVYISKALLNMMPKMDMGMDMGGVNIKDLTSKLERLEIYNGEGAEASKLIKTEMDKLAKNKTYETLMSMKDGNETITFFALKSKGKFKDLIMYMSSSNDSSVIRIIGDFTAEDIQGVVDGTEKKK